jgi:hypothetical protein
MSIDPFCSYLGAMDVTLIVALVLLAISGLVTLVRAARSVVTADVVGLMLLGILFLIAVDLRFEALTVSRYNDVRLGPTGSLLLAAFKSLVVPSAAASALLVGGRWHQALLAGAIAAVLPMDYAYSSLASFWEVFLFLGVLGAAAFWRNRRWNELGVAMSAFAVAGICVFLDRYLSRAIQVVWSGCRREKPSWTGASRRGSVDGRVPRPRRR